jgi:hypothetical protein
VAAGRQARSQRLRVADEVRDIDHPAAIEYQGTLQIAIGKQRQSRMWCQVRLKYRGQIPTPSGPDDCSVDRVADRRRALESPDRPIQNIRKFPPEC